MRFTIRDLLWLTVVVALGVAWCVDRSRLVDKVNSQALWLKYFDAISSSPLPPNPSPPIQKLPGN